jgi:hypothetical protein
MNRLLIISTLIVLTSCSQSTQSDISEKQADRKESTLTEIESTKTSNEIGTESKSVGFECTGFDFSSAREQSDSLLVFMERATRLNSINRQKWEQMFFCAFPDSFENMQEVFGFDIEEGAAPLYDHPTGTNVIQYFRHLESIPDSIYFDKYVKININGVWEADNIREAFNFGSRLSENTKNACMALSKFSDIEIKSVFRFIFDGPHPKNKYNENLYNKLKPKIDSQDKRLGRILGQAYDELMAENDRHGH